MKIHLDKTILASPVSASFPLFRLIRAGWGRFFLAAVLLGAGYLTWALNWMVHRDWTEMIVPVVKQYFTAESGSFSINFQGFGYALLAFLILFLMGVLSAGLFLPQEPDRWLKRLTTLLMGFGLIGTITTFLAAFFQFHFSTLCIALFGAFLCLFIGTIALKKKRGLSISTIIMEIFLDWKFGKDDFSGNPRKWLATFCLIFFGVMEYQALRFIEMDWDALIYHATMAKLIFSNGGIPIIAGPSAGLELSANYPPLFSALGAYFYAFSRQFNDTFIRMLAPIFSMINLLAVYKIGRTFGGFRLGVFAVVLLLFTPLYFSRSLSATNYLPETTFLTAALLFLIKWHQTRQNHYLTIFGMMFGFALLTSYHALIFAPSILILSIFLSCWTENQERKRLWLPYLSAISIALGIYGIWLLRNTIYLHNPIYPFGSQWFGGLHFDAVMFNQTVNAIRQDSIFNYFGTYTPSISIYLQRLFVNRSQFPVISILLILGILLIPLDQNRRGWAIVGLYALPVGLLLASTWVNIFPRYFVLILPECALIVAFLFTKILNWGSFSFVRTSAVGLQKFYSFNTTMHLIAGILVGLMFVFPGNLAVILGKQYGEADIFKPNYWKQIPDSQDKYGTLTIVYGEGIRAWEWLKPKTANTNERIASFENRTYYLTDNVNTMLYLDGWEAKPIYAMTEPTQALAYLKAHQVTYILDPYWVKNWEVYHLLPLDRFLGDPQYFPLVFDSPEAKIYRVGQVEDPLTNHSPLTISLSPTGWSQPELHHEFWSRKIAKNTTTARLFVSYADQITLSVGYLDSGTGTVDINVKKPDGTWDYSTHLILTNSSQWITRDLELPHLDPTAMVEIGIFSQSDDFIVNHLSARRSQ